MLVADEVLSGLDPDSTKSCFEILMEFAHRQGRLLVCVLHDPDLCRTADKRLHLSSGALEEN